MKAVILVEPEIPENTGFTARLADNYDAELRVVNPDFQLDEARKTATNAQQKLRDTKIYENLEEAVKDLEQVIGTKPGRGLPVEKFQPRENTSVIIGRESSGLSNKELDMCDAVVHIDLPGYSSMNQSHAAAVLMHELSSSPEERSLSTEQKKAIGKILGDGKIKELLLRASPTSQEYDRLMGELKKLGEKQP
ncbi:MAG: RNA methyltransferase [Candidatus Nanohalobium sp.]